MDPLTTSPNYDNTSNKKFGEIYCNYLGVLSFHCVLCPKQMDHSDDFILHYMIHFRDVFEIKQESMEDADILEPDVGIAEPEPYSVSIEIKLEQAEVNTTSGYDEIKTEPKYLEDNYASTDQSFSEVESKHSSKMKLMYPRKCGICGETFVVKKLLKDHIRIHQAGPVPKFYECDVCGRRVNQKKNLLTHIRRRHGQKVKCQICGKMLRQHYMVWRILFENNRTLQKFIDKPGHVLKIRFYNMSFCSLIIPHRLIFFISSRLLTYDVIIMREISNVCSVIKVSFPPDLLFMNVISITQPFQLSLWLASLHRI